MGLKHTVDGYSTPYPGNYPPLGFSKLARGCRSQGDFKVDHSGKGSRYSRF